LGRDSGIRRRAGREAPGVGPSLHRGPDQAGPAGSVLNRLGPSANPCALCALCGGQAGGLVFQYQLDRRFPEYLACSFVCLDAIVQLVTENHGTMPMITIMERNAVIAARKSLYEALVSIGREAAFNDCTAEQMDSVIECVWNGLRASMSQQSALGEVPF
jgi:hypothetical protein